MSQEKDQLKNTLARLERSVEKILSTRGYTEDVKPLKLLQEIIREQLTSPNSRSATRAIR